MNERKEEISVSVRLTPRQQQELREAVAARGLTLASYIRQAALLSLRAA